MDIKESIMSKLNEVDIYTSNAPIQFVENAKELYSRINTACAIYGLESSAGVMFLINDEYITMDVLASVRFSKSYSDEHVINFLEHMNSNESYYREYFVKELKFFKTLFVESVTTRPVELKPYSEYNMYCNNTLANSIYKFIQLMCSCNIDTTDEDVKYNTMVVESIYSSYIMKYFKDHSEPIDIYSNYKCALRGISEYSSLIPNGLIQILAGMKEPSENVMRYIIDSIPADVNRRDDIENYIIDVINFVIYGCETVMNVETDKGTPFRFISKIIGMMNCKSYISLMKKQAFLYKLLGLCVELSSMTHNLTAEDVFNGIRLSRENSEEPFTLDMLGTEIRNNDVEINEEFCFKLIEVIDNIYNVSHVSLNRAIGLLNKKMHDCVKCIRALHDMKAILQELSETGESKYNDIISKYDVYKELNHDTVLKSFVYYDAERTINSILELFDRFSEEVKELFD